MLKAETTSTRAPRGTKPVSQAFFTALDAVPEASRVAVAKAAQTMIRDELKARKEKMKVVAAKEKEKARKPVVPVKAATAKPAAKVKAKTPKVAAEKMPAPKEPMAAKANGAEPVTVPVKRRAKKVADVPTTV